jgi:hypothetical protein
MTMNGGGREDAMAWMKVDAARKYAGGVGRKVLYKAVASGRLKAARIGAGRSLLFCDTWIDEWLVASAGEQPDMHATANPLAVGREASGTKGLRLVGRR